MPSKRPINQRGEMHCSMCGQWRPLDAFKLTGKDKARRRSYCVTCQRTYDNERMRHRYRTNPDARADMQRRANEWASKKRAQVFAERQDMVIIMLDALADRGFTREQIGEMTGMTEATLSYLRHGKSRCVQARSYSLIEAVYLLFVDMPVVGRPKRGRRSDPTPITASMPMLMRRTAPIREQYAWNAAA